MDKKLLEKTLTEYVRAREVAKEVRFKASAGVNNSIGIFDKTPFYRTINVLRLIEKAF